MATGAGSDICGGAGPHSLRHGMAKPSRVLARVVSLAMCAILAAILRGRDGGHESRCGQRLGLFEHVSLLFGESLLYRAAAESGAAQIRWAARSGRSMYGALAAFCLLQIFETAYIMHLRRRRFFGGSSEKLPFISQRRHSSTREKVTQALYTTKAAFSRRAEGEAQHTSVTNSAKLGCPSNARPLAPVMQLRCSSCFVPCSIHAAHHWAS